MRDRRKRRLEVGLRQWNAQWTTGHWWSTAAAGGDGRHGGGPVDVEDGAGYEDAGRRLTIMVTEAGSRRGIGLGVG